MGLHVGRTSCMHVAKWGHVYVFMGVCMYVPGSSGPRSQKSPIAATSLTYKTWLFLRIDLAEDDSKQYTHIGLHSLLRTITLLVSYAPKTGNAYTSTSIGVLRVHLLSAEVDLCVIYLNRVVKLLIMPYVTRVICPVFNRWPCWYCYM